MRWLNNTLKDRVGNNKNRKEAMKLIDRAAFVSPSTANAQRRHLANMYLSGVVNKNILRQLLNKVAVAVPPVSPFASPERPKKKTTAGQSSPIPIPTRKRR
jgi:hypothetical protein